MAIKLVENYAVSMARHDVRDSLQMHGERCIVLAMYHNYADKEDFPACPYCTDDVYTGSGKLCTVCFGTSIQGGVKQAALVWGMFTDDVKDEKASSRGLWKTDEREFHTQHTPLLVEHDYVVRVRRWNDDYTPAEIEGYYGIRAVTQNSLRTGDRFGQTTADIVGQRAQISRVSDAVDIAKYPVIGVSFSAATDANPTPLPPPIVAPNSMVVIPPVSTAKYAYTIGDGASTTITINHMLGTKELVVQLYDVASGEQVDTNVYASTISSVTLTFQDPPPTDSLRAVIFA
jgi:hypothetical protein